MSVNVLFLITKLVPFGVVAMLFYLIKQILAPKKNFSDFFIGDSGTYSLSRLQIVAWVYIILSVQVGIIISLILKGTDYIYYYNLVLPEEVLFLLGLSSASYLAVKNITVNEIEKKQKAKIKLKNISDIIIGNNGLDFTKFQFLIWTIIAASVYLLHCSNYINLLSSSSEPKIIQKYLSENFEALPKVSWSFIILMGLSQGAYVGKKLVPDFKIEEFKTLRNTELSKQFEIINSQIELKTNLANLAKPETETGLKQIQDMKLEITDLKNKKMLLSEELNRSQF